MAKLSKNKKAKTPKAGGKPSTVEPKTKKKPVKQPKQKRPEVQPVVEKKVRNFVLLNTDNEEIGRYTGKAPRQAALKVANTGVTNIRLRETGVRRKVKVGGKDKVEVKIHLFKGSRKQRNKKASDPEWLPAKINYPVVKKKGVEWLPWSN
jgi:hypothetical protein